jgi:o-succinylbenzoate---CoA ligase
MAREFHPLLIPSGRSVLDLLPAISAALDGTGPALLPVTADEGDRLTSAMGVGQPVEDRTALVIGTSGSTGVPKGALLSAEAVKASVAATHARLGGPGSWLLAMSARYIGGLQVLIRAMLAGTEPGVVDLSGGFRPDEFAKAALPVLAADGPHYTALVPTQLSRLISEGGAGLEALCAFGAIVLGGAPASESLLVAARAAGAKPVPSYGMSETAGGCVYDGVPLEGMRVRLTAGRIDLSGPMIAHGYRLHSTESHGGESPFVDGWFHTSDLGRWLPDGRLEVVGRIDDLINTGGVKVPPVLVERALTALPGVAEACVVGVEDPAWGQAVAAAIVPTDPANPPAESALREAVHAEVGRTAVPKLFRSVAQLPLLGPGKIDRTAVRAMLRGSNAST